MDTRPPRAQLLRQLDTLERQLALIRSELLPERPAPVAEPFKAVALAVGGMRYAIPSAEVQRVIPLVGWRPLPEAPDWVLGLFRFEGQTSMLLDLHHRLHGRAAALSTSMVIIVTKAPDAVGLVAESVSGVVEIAPEQVTAPPGDVSYAPFLLGSVARPDAELMHLLAPERLRRELVGLSEPGRREGEGR